MSNVTGAHYARNYTNFKLGGHRINSNAFDRIYHLYTLLRMPNSNSNNSNISSSSSRGELRVCYGRQLAAVTDTVSEA